MQMDLRDRTASIEQIRARIAQLRAAGDKERLGCISEEMLGRFEQLLSSEDPKVRKNTAMLLGQLPWNLYRATEETSDSSGVQLQRQYARLLFSAYQKEETLFVRPAYLKALSSYPVQDFETLLTKRNQQISELLSGGSHCPQSDRKHLRQELLALEHLQDAGDQDPVHPVHLPKHPVTVFYLARSAVHPLLEKRYPDAKDLGWCVRVRGTLPEKALSERLYEQIFFAVLPKRDHPLSPDHLDEALCASSMIPMISEFLGDPKDYVTFRVEISGEQTPDRKIKLTRRLSAELTQQSGGFLRNRKEHCEVLLHLQYLPNLTYRAGIFFNGLSDQRFSYRRQILPTSMKPVAAAQMTALAAPFMKPSARVLDPFCGTAALLIERARLSGLKPSALYGVDLFRQAIEAGEANAKAAGERIFFVQRDYFTFTHEILFDEVLTEFPDLFEQSAEEAELFYEKFFLQTGRLLKQGGVAFLLCRGGNRIHMALRHAEEFHFIREIPFSGKRNLYIIQRK